MKCAIYLSLALLLFGCTPKPSQLEQELAATEQRLTELPRMKIDTLVPTLGYSSEFLEREDAGDLITITFTEPKPIDTVVLVPLNFLNNKNEYTPIGFPVRFTIEAETIDNDVFSIADYSETDFASPGISPVLFSTADTRLVRKLTLTVTKLAQAQIWLPEQYVFMLNELLVFSGEENIALNAPVDAEKKLIQPLKFDPAYLVDGYSYFPPFEPEVKNPYRNFRSSETEIQLFFDLGKTQTLNEARFYPNDFTAEFSHIHSSAIGFPMEIELKLSSTLSFDQADSVVIAKSNEPMNMSRSPLCKKFQPISGRYVKITLAKGRQDPAKRRKILSLSEIELLHNGVNRIGGLPFRTATPPVLADDAVMLPERLTDELSAFGRIVSPKQSFQQLAERAELEAQRAALLQKNERNYARQQKAFRTLIISTPILALSFVFILLAYRYRNGKQVQQVRERIADDLHDETGATLSSIANSAQLLAELSTDKHTAKENELLSDIIQNAERSASETRALILFLERDSSEGDLTEQLQKTARQMLSGVSLTEDYQAGKQLNRLPPILQWDILLLFKEVLNNIIKHAEADAVQISVQKKGAKIALEIHDNGIGLPSNIQPTHLIKRAKKLNAQISFTSPSSGGTTITCLLSQR
ncbi:MAG: sensor histidine kinase [Coraliomargarita sp.]